jgi:hypothetical protein|tara:strand:- start:564 stop:860 length:297 start_codon:yes stop_codon:yes gene_type:complete
MEISDLIPVAALVASIIAASAVARFQIKKLELDTNKLDTRLDQQDIRLDKLTTASEIFEQRVGILAQILSPAELERRTREIEAIRKDVEWIRQKVDTL